MSGKWKDLMARLPPEQQQRIREGTDALLASDDETALHRWRDSGGPREDSEPSEAGPTKEWCMQAAAREDGPIYPAGVPESTADAGLREAAEWHVEWLEARANRVRDVNPLAAADFGMQANALRSVLAAAPREASPEPTREALHRIEAIAAACEGRDLDNDAILSIARKALDAAMPDNPTPAAPRDEARPTEAQIDAAVEVLKQESGSDHSLRQRVRAALFAALAAAPRADPRPDVNAQAIWEKMPPHHQGRTSLENINDTLEAMVWFAAARAPGREP